MSPSPSLPAGGAADDRSPDLPAGLRRVTDADADGLIALVGAAYDEYPGCVLDLPGIDDDLPIPGTTAGRRGSAWWVVERDGRIVGSIGCGPVDADGQVELKRLYLDAAVRGQGLASRLVRLVEGHAAGLGARAVSLWSDTRFAAAHGRYAALGYARTGASRELHDPSDTTEWHFVREVTPRAVARTVTWDGPHGRDVATLVALPDGWLLTSSVDGGEVVSRVEVDGDWRTRVAEVRTGATTRRLSTDASGRWWRDGHTAPELDGCVDVDVEVSPLTNTLPIRRLLATGTDEAAVPAAWLRVPGPAVERLDQRYVRIDEHTWRYESPGFATELTVDADGLVVRYGTWWSAVTA
ncbi:GNAT family N-acetyltransferase [Nitriliruptoraceae bacterium ZYF776]|nr:GNAT family N-acetyltransferase [Profundirhabdus halotolerans]